MYLFKPRFHLNRLQFNLFGVFFISIGFIAGSYILMKDIIPKIFAVNDTHNTWNFDLASASQYTYNNTDLEISNSGITAKNRITNGTFDTNTSGWSGTQIYSLNDEFASDPVQTLISDTFGRGDGAIGTAETGGAWVDNNGTWTVNGNTVKNTPATGNDLVSNGNMEAGSPPTSWVNVNSTLTTESTIKHAGNASLKITSSGTNSSGFQAITTVTGGWYLTSIWGYGDGVNSYKLQFIQHVSPWTAYVNPSYSAASWTNSIATTRVNDTLTDIRGWTNINGAVIYTDDASVKLLTLPSLFTTINTSTANIQAQSKVTVTSGTQAGLVLNLDSTSNPQNFRLVYTDGTNIYIDDVVNGVYTNKQTTAHGVGTLVYGAGKVLSVVDKGTSLTVTYGGVAVGSTQTMTANTNTKHGLFSTYSGNTFDDVSVKTLLNGTLATDGVNVRTVTDTENKVSISSGNLSFSGGLTTPVYGSPGIWYPSVSRTAGKSLLVSLNQSGNTNTGYDFGWDVNTSGMPDQEGLYVTGNRGINTQTGDITIGNIVNGTTYTYATVLRSTGAYYYVKGGVYTDWTLLWVSNTNSSLSLYPTVANYNGIFYADNIRIPTATWLPTPLASDGFSGQTTDGLGDIEASGGSGLAWTGATWTVSGGTLTNTPSTDTELLTDTGLEGNYSSGLNVNLTKTGSPTLTQSADTHGGAKSQAFTGIAQSDSIRNAVLGASGRWWIGSLWGKRTSGTGGGAYATLGLTGVSTPGLPITSASFSQYIISDRSGNSSATRWMGVYENGTSNFDSVIVDDLSLKTLTLSSLFRTVSIQTNNVLADVKIPTYTLGTQAGLVIGLDSAQTPTNFLIAYLNGRGQATVEQVLEGTYSTIVTAATATWNASGVLRVVKDGTAIRLYYNNVLIGSGTCSASITGTLVGVFSTYSGNTFDNFVVWARSGYASAPFEDLTVSQDTGTKYSGAASVKLVSLGTDSNFTQSVTVGDTNTYSFSALAYKGVGQTVTTDDINIYYDTGIVATTFESIGNDWYRLSANVIGSASARTYGFRVKANKTIYIDNVLLVKTGNLQVYTTTAYTNANVSTWDSLANTITNPGTSSVKYQLCTDNGSSCESGNSWKYYNGSAWATSTNISTDANTLNQLTTDVLQTFPANTNMISIKAILQSSNYNTPTISAVTLGLTTDILPPSVNASDIVMRRTADGTVVSLDSWTKESSPRFDWTSGSDNPSNPTGIQGYCLYLGPKSNGEPTTEKGILGTSPIDPTGKPCMFIVSTPYIDFSTVLLRGNDWLTSSTEPYYLNIKAIDNADLPYEGDSATFSFKFDNTPPENVSYISCASGNFGNVVDMNFAWPTTGDAMSSDDTSEVLGWQYQINSTENEWKGTVEEDPNILGVVNYIPTSEDSINLTNERDGLSIHSGNNIVYFRTVDNAGKPSTDATIRTCSLSFGGQAPQFGGSDKVTITPDTKTDNNFALSWPEATPTTNQHITHYYYMVGPTPPSTLATLQSNASTYIDNGTSTTVATRDLPNVNKGTNNVYVVAIDDATPPNYSPSNYISGSFILNSTDPDNVGDLVASDSSIKSKTQWNVTLTWTEPVYKGAGNLSYKVYRSDDNVAFTQVGVASGLSYVDNVPSSRTYYYKVITKDGANALSSGTNSVSILPTGKWTEAPALETEPVVSNITTKKAVISWSTSRTSDSKISYGIKSETYEVVEPSSSDQVTAHSIQLIGLNPNTTYFFKAKWTDEDGNTGTSDEYSFKTQPAPVVKNVVISNIGLTNSLISYSVKGASKVKIFYGKTTSFGGVIEVPTSLTEATYSSILSTLEDGTKYYFRLDTYDVENADYTGDIYSFTTLPRPRISNVQIQQVANTAQSTLQVSWDSNTEISSIVTYYPEGKPGDSKDEVSVQLVKGEHKLVLRGLLPETSYYLIVKGRDKVGNEAVSGIQKVTTATDTRPPVLTSLAVEGSVVPKTVSTAQETYAQLVVSWTTDEPATSQVEYGEGSGSAYSQRTQLDANLTYNHIVIISGLTPSKVYHLKAISRDKAGNESTSIDTVTITPKATDNAFNLVIANLEAIFGFLPTK